MTKEQTWKPTHTQKGKYGYCYIRDNVQRDGDYCEIKKNRQGDVGDIINEKTVFNKAV